MSRRTSSSAAPGTSLRLAKCSLSRPAGQLYGWKTSTISPRFEQCIRRAPLRLGLSIGEDATVYRQWTLLDNGGSVETLRLKNGKVEADFVRGTRTSTAGGLVSFCSVQSCAARMSTDAGRKRALASAGTLRERNSRSIWAAIPRSRRPSFWAIPLLMAAWTEVFMWCHCPAAGRCGRSKRLSAVQFQLL